MKNKTGTRMVGGNTGKHARAENDFYPTPAETTQALLDKVKFDKFIWEPACGKLDIVMKLRENSYDVLPSDIISRDNCVMFIQDFLNLETEATKFDTWGERDIITNPPFSLATEFILQAKRYAKRKIAMLARINLLEGVERYKKLWCDDANINFPLSQVLCFTRRQKFMRENIDKKDGSALIFFAWFIWDKEHKGKPNIEWI